MEIRIPFVWYRGVLGSDCLVRVKITLKGTCTFFYVHSHAPYDRKRDDKEKWTCLGDCKFHKLFFAVGV